MKAPLNRRRLLLAAALLPVLGASAQSPTPVGGPAEVVAELPGARLLGSGTLRFLGLRVYDGRLWVGATAPASDWQATPFALELQYQRNLKGELIAERSLKEMRRQGEIDDVTAERWLGNMKQLFPDVQPGHRITGVNLPGVGARFFINGQLRGELRELEFARYFFGIWLSPRTSEPAMREELLGLKSTRPAS
jgi:Chalcone isomerase-like